MRTVPLRQLPAPPSRRAAGSPPSWRLTTSIAPCSDWRPRCTPAAAPRAPKGRTSEDALHTGDHAAPHAHRRSRCPSKQAARRPLVQMLAAPPPVPRGRPGARRRTRPLSPCLQAEAHARALLTNTNLSAVLRPQHVVNIKDSASVDQTLRVRLRGAPGVPLLPAHRAAAAAAAACARLAQRRRAHAAPRPAPLQVLAAHRILSAPVVVGNGGEGPSGDAGQPAADKAPEVGAGGQWRGPAASGGQCRGPGWGRRQGRQGSRAVAGLTLCACPALPTLPAPLSLSLPPLPPLPCLPA